MNAPLIPKFTVFNEILKTACICWSIRLLQYYTFYANRLCMWGPIQQIAEHFQVPQSTEAAQHLSGWEKYTQLRIAVLALDKRKKVTLLY